MSFEFVLIAKRKEKRLCQLIAPEMAQSQISNLWTHLKTHHKIYPDGRGPPVPNASQTTLNFYGITYLGDADPIVNLTLDEAIIQWIIDTQQPFDIVDNEKWKRMWKITFNIPRLINSH
jgi:hypothetical protein